MEANRAVATAGASGGTEGRTTHGRGWALGRRGTTANRRPGGRGEGGGGQVVGEQRDMLGGTGVDWGGAEVVCHLRGD